MLLFIFIIQKYIILIFTVLCHNLRSGRICPAAPKGPFRKGRQILFQVASESSTRRRPIHLFLVVVTLLHRFPIRKAVESTLNRTLRLSAFLNQPQSSLSSPLVRILLAPTFQKHTIVTRMLVAQAVVMALYRSLQIGRMCRAALKGHIMEAQ
jgi:hypothetical protein